MVTLTADVTEGIKDMAQTLIKKGIYKSQSEVVRDAIRQLAYKYGVDAVSIHEVRKITRKAVKRGKTSLSQSVRKMRADAA